MMKRFKTFFFVNVVVLLFVPSFLSAEGGGAREEFLSALELSKNTENFLRIARKMQKALGDPKTYYLIVTLDGEERFHQRQAVHEGVVRLWKEDPEFCKKVLLMFEALEEGAAQAEFRKIEREGKAQEEDFRTLEKWVYVPTGRILLDLRAADLIKMRQYQEARRIYDLLLMTTELFPKPVSKKTIINGLLRCESSVGNKARITELLKSKGEGTIEDALFDLRQEERAKHKKYVAASMKEFGFNSFGEAKALTSEKSKNLPSRMRWHMGERFFSIFSMTCKLLDLASLGSPLSSNQELKKEDLPAITAFLKMAIKDADSWQRRRTAVQLMAAAIDEEWKNADSGGHSVLNLGSINFAPIQKGIFEMGDLQGDGYNDEKPVHTVVITKDFEMQKTEVTQRQWTAVMGSNPSRFQNPDHPVEQVSWNEVQPFIAKLNEKKDGYTYRLPTEAEWEYAARAGMEPRYSFGHDASVLDQYGWYDGNSNNTTHPVAQLKPNAFGIYDMHGNVWEWVSDWYGAYSQGMAIDPQGPTAGSARVIRGGGWGSIPRGLRSAIRGYVRPDDRGGNVGFRLVRTKNNP